MRLLQRWQLCLIVAATLFSANVQAEYYLECNEVVPNVVSIDCKGHHCRWDVQHYSNYHRDTRHHRNRYIVKYCDQDMATGDDNACRYPGMQIN